MAEAVKPSGQSQDAEVKAQQPAEKNPGAPPKRDPYSVVRVSEVVLRALTSHKGLTLAVLKRELGQAGYQMRRKCLRHSGEAPKSNILGTLLRISGSNGSRYFRVWKTPKPKKKPGRPRLVEGTGPSRRRRVRRKAAKKAREVWRRKMRAATTRKRSRSRPRAKDRMRFRAKKEMRTKATARGRGRTRKEDKSRIQEKRPREEKKQDHEKPIKGTIQRPAAVKTDSRAAPTKTSNKSESSRNTAGNP